MTPQEHLDRAELLLTVAEHPEVGRGGPWIANNLMAALCHALIAHAAENGVAHSAESPALPGPVVGGE